MREKIQIRQINDIQGNSYPIYDYMVKNYFGMWVSKCTYFELDDALRWHSGIVIEDIRE